MSNVKNYTEQGGEKTVIGGTLEIKEDATVTGLPDGSDNVLPVTSNQVDSTATDLAGLLTDFNTLLSKLKTAGLMAADE